jgi:hypothetical protein
VFLLYDRHGIRDTWGIYVFIMQIDYVKISCKNDVHICHTNLAKQMEQNLHETTSRWKTYGKWLFSKDLEVQDVVLPTHIFGEALLKLQKFITYSNNIQIIHILEHWNLLKMRIKSIIFFIILLIVNSISS